MESLGQLYITTFTLKGNSLFSIINKIKQKQYNKQNIKYINIFNILNHFLIQIQYLYFKLACVQFLIIISIQYIMTDTQKQVIDMDRKISIQKELKTLQRIEETLHHHLSFQSGDQNQQLFLNLFQSTSQLKQKASKLLQKKNYELELKTLQQDISQYQYQIHKAKQTAQNNERRIRIYTKLIEQIYKIQVNLIQKTFQLKQCQARIKTVKHFQHLISILQDKYKSILFNYNPKNNMKEKTITSNDVYVNIYANAIAENRKQNQEKSQYKVKLTRNLDYLQGKQRALKEDYYKVLRKDYDNKKNNILGMHEMEITGQRSHMIAQLNHKQTKILAAVPSNDTIKLNAKQNKFLPFIQIFLGVLSLIVICLAIFK